MSFIEPVRRIVTEDDLVKWKEGQTHADIVEFVAELAKSVVGKTNDAECIVSESVQGLLNLLDDISAIIDKHPVADKSSSRFGKLEFKDVYDEITDTSVELMKKHIPSISTQPNGDASVELSVYLNESWGNRTRIDYGSGHELNFLAFLLCLRKLNIISKEDDTAVVLKVFNQYIAVMRLLQKEYWLEPAGSHGVWGLDDYHFLPFLFGAAQLSTHKHLRPKSIHDEDMVEMFHKKYMYFACIHFINSIKTASLRWHSPMLDDISGVKTWSKVSEGMQKMYIAEVLGKLPIIQHFFFGSILVAPEGCTPAREPHTHGAECDHTHHDNDSEEGLPAHQHTWGDCCGIKVPSAIAAREMEKSAPKPIPFD
ncbi:CYFA0S06e01024g1_1 [Cyberlindnera fabianii]|uniref:Serine/threonine-protein phosphatase 2A activator n=1 Tax=Cyberlindnera fabianii TaxID=36022 RepID=A0A061AV72_CYBFA|nr:Serine/threonine-protein phosphatase 2A activator 2 [Cyberlindnera fabianii]CDR41070.1 CYFA0S06e01024g1_1 [Cyberlindnera fabianii]